MKYKFSPSKIEMLEDCRKCFWLEHNRGIKRPDGIFPSLPSGMDQIFKEHFDSYMEKGELPPELKELKDVKLFDDKDLLKKWRLNMVGMKYEAERFIIKGAIDNLLVKGKKLILLDYKTRGYELKEDTHHHYIKQQALYNYILRKNGYETEDYSYLLFYYPDRVVENVILFHKRLVKIDTDMAVAQAAIDKALEVLDGPMPKASETCNFCKYRESSAEKTLNDF
jgi:CRISPR/Cas system-associated exonuclease Cas4 (RecB family)